MWYLTVKFTDGEQQQFSFNVMPLIKRSGTVDGFIVIYTNDMSLYIAEIDVKFLKFHKPS